MTNFDNRVYVPALRLQASHNGPLRGNESYQFGFYDAGVLRELLDHLGPGSGYQVWTLPVPQTPEEFAEAITILHDEDVLYSLVNKDKIVYVTLTGVDLDNAGWLQLLADLGYHVHSGPKTNKRLKSFHRPTLLNARFDDLGVMYVDPIDFTRYDFSNSDPDESVSDRLCHPEVVERLLDGGFVVSRRVIRAAVENLPLYDLGETSDPHDYYFDPRIRRQLVHDLLTANVFNARFVFADGFLKGNCFVSDNMPDGIDIITSQTNVKAEITYDRGFRFQAEPQGPKARVFTDDQTMVNFPKLFPAADLDMWLREDYDKIFDNAINNRLLPNWQYVYQRLWHDDEDINENEARARMAYVGYRWKAAGFDLTQSPWLFETTAISQAKPMERRISIPCSVYEQVIPESLARMAGFEMEVEEETIVRLSELGVHVVNDLDWLEMYESHGGHDEDDFFKLFYRTMDGGDYDGERVVIAMRSPNGYGEYSVFRYVENTWSPKWHMADGTEITFPVVDGTDWPIRLSDAIFLNQVAYRGLPSSHQPKQVRSGPYTPDDVIRDIRIAMSGGNVGGFVNACMVHASTLAHHRPLQLCSLEDAIDKCINPDDAADVAAIDAEARAMMREVVASGLPVDWTLWNKRGSRRFLKRDEELTFTEGPITEMYNLCAQHNARYQNRVRDWSQANCRPPQIVHDLGLRMYHWALPYLRDFRSTIYERDTSQETAASGRIERNSWEDLYSQMVDTICSFERLQDRHDFVLGLYSCTMNTPTTAGRLTDQIVMNRFVFPYLEAALQYYGQASIPTYDRTNDSVKIRVIRYQEWAWPDCNGDTVLYRSPLEFQQAHALDSPLDFRMAAPTEPPPLKSIV